MIAPNRFPDSVFDRIGSYLPLEQRTAYFRYVAHLRSLNPKDELLVLAEGMAIFTCLARQVPEALGTEREKLLTELARLTARHEAATAAATADVRALFTAQQKLLEQNIATWQNREEAAAHSLDRTAKRFEETANRCTARLEACSTTIQAAAARHLDGERKALQWISRVSLENWLWPCVASFATGALLILLIVYFFPQQAAWAIDPLIRRALGHPR